MTKKEKQRLIDREFAKLQGVPQLAKYGQGFCLKLARRNVDRQISKGPCYCGTCHKCIGYKDAFEDKKKSGLWEGPGKREWSLWPAPDWATILKR